MLSCNPVADIAYLIGKQEDRERDDAVLPKDASGDERVDALREGIRVHKGNSYYDKDSAEEEGVFWRPKLKESVFARMMKVEEGKVARVGAGRRLADGIEVGNVVPTKVARLLSMGYDPVTKESLVKTATAWHEKKAKYPEKMTPQQEARKPRAGYDNTFSIDKPVSALWADAVTRGDIVKAKAIEDAIRAAVIDAKQFMYDNGLIRTRRVDKDPTTGERIEYYESVADFTAVDFLHKTNRNGEPQLHVHSLMLNVCVREDGTTGTISTDELFYMKPVVDAVFKASFYDRLRQIEGLEQIDFARGEHDVRIRGINPELVKTLSTRRLEVVEELERRGLTTKDRRAAEMAAKATRNEKTDLPPLSELVGRWKETILAFTDGEGLLAKLEKRKATKEDRDTKLLRVAMEAVERFGHTQTVVDERDVLTAVYRSSQGEFGISEIPEIVHYVKTNFLINAEYDKDGRARWGIRDLVEKERSFMSMCYNLPAMSRMATDSQIQVVLDKYKANPAKKVRGLNDEQKAGISYILSSTSAIAILEGSAGAGKSFTSGRIKEVLDPAGFSIYGISPSWKATDVLRNDIALEDKMAKACAKFIADYKTGKISIDSKTIVAIDEAGMVGIDDMEYIARVISEKGGRLLLLGDTQQLSPVAAGSPMAMATRVLGSHRLNEIMRQNDPANPERSARYREASGLFVKQGKENIEQALGIYRDEGRIAWKEGLEQTYHAAADKFMELYDPKRPKETIIITNRNADLHAINAEVRKAMIEKGMLAEDEVTFEALTRNSRDKEYGEQLSLRAGERVIFGERLETKVSGLPIPINNSDMATVKAIHRDPETGEPILHLVFDKDPKKVIRANPRQLSGFREEGEKLIPKLQLAYAVTTYASQGATVDQVVVADCNGMDYRQTYVNLTRHRHDCHLLVNVGRIEDNKAAKAGIVLIDDNGKMSIPDNARQDVAPEDFQYGPDEWFKYIVHEASRIEDKKNFTDLEMYRDIEKLKAFLADGNWTDTHLAKMQEHLLTQIDIQEKRIIDNKARKEGKIGASLAADGDTINHKEKPIAGTTNPYRDLKTPSLVPNLNNLRSMGGDDMDDALKTKIAERVSTLRRVVPPPRQAIEAARQRMEAAVVEKALVAEKVATKFEVLTSKRISQAEMDHIRKQDPSDFVQRHGFTLVNEGKGKYDFCESKDKNGAHGRFSFKNFSDGGWGYIKANNEDMKGAIWNWMVDYRFATSKIDALHQLRDHFHTEKYQDTKVVAKPEVIEKPKPTSQAYRETIAEQLAATGFPKTPEQPKLEDRFQFAIDEFKRKQAEAAANPGNKEFEPSKLDEFRAKAATKWMAVIEKGNDPNADKFTTLTATRAREMAEEGKSFHDFRFKFEMKTPWISDELPKQRGIERRTILYFEDDVRRDAYKDMKSGEWKSGLAFAHRDVVKWGTITGYETKRPVSFYSDGREMPRNTFTTGEGKGLGMLGPKKKGEASTIVVAESGVDGLSWWQEKRLPTNFKSMTDDQKAEITKKVPNDILILSTAGASAPHAMQGLELLAQSNKQAKWIIAPDNDETGHRIRDKVQAAILRGNPEADVTVQAPENVLFKDWNDQTRQMPRSAEDLQKTADKLHLASEFIREEVAKFEKQHPDKDMSAYRSIGSKEADAAEKQKAIDVLMTADDKEIRQHIEAKKAPAFSQDARRDSEAAAKRAAAEAEKRRQQEEAERARSRGSVQRM